MMDTSPIVSSNGQLAIIVTAVLGFVTTILNLAHTAKKDRILLQAQIEKDMFERREMAKRDQDDRDLKAEKQRAELATAGNEISNRMDRKATKIAGDLHSAIQENTDISAKAFQEANNTNEKIRELKADMLRLQTEFIKVLTKEKN